MNNVVGISKIFGDHGFRTRRRQTITSGNMNKSSSDMLESFGRIGHENWLVISEHLISCLEQQFYPSISIILLPNFFLLDVGWCF